MSFILDALKKSESERQTQGSAEFSQVPVSRESGKPPLWLWLLGALLAVNLIVLAGVLLRPAPERLPARTVTSPGFAEQLEVEKQESLADRSPPANANTSPVTGGETETASPTVAQTTGSGPVQAPARVPDSTPVQTPAPTTNTDITRGIPDIDQLRASGNLPVGELRLDIHVYSDTAADRFVFINMVKHREGSTTSDGLSVDAITPDGVVLTYRGQQFLLPRQ